MKIDDSFIRMVDDHINHIVVHEAVKIESKYLDDIRDMRNLNCDLRSKIEKLQKQIEKLQEKDSESCVLQNYDVIIECRINDKDQNPIVVVQKVKAKSFLEAVQMVADDKLDHAVTQIKRLDKQENRG